MLKIEKSHKFEITLQNLMLILKPLELNVIIVENIMHVILLLMAQVICGVIVCKKFPFVVDKKQKVLVLEPKIEKGELGEQNVGSLKAIGYNYDECRQALAKMVIIDELPFNFVEGREFKLFARTMQPRFDIPSRFTIMRDCLKLYVEEKDRLRTALRG